jgi:predicted nucleic acid-binding protein
MGRLTDRLTGYSSLGVDTAIFIYHLESHPNYNHLTQVLFSGVEDGKWTALTSVITLMELTVRPWQLGRDDIAYKYEALLVNFPNLKILDVDRNVSRRAAQLRASYNLHPADAIQIATSLVGGSQAYITNDRRLSRLNPVLDIIILDDLVIE